MGFDEVCPCSYSPLLPQLACNILAITHKDYFRAEYINILLDPPASWMTWGRMNHISQCNILGEKKFPVIGERAGKPENPLGSA